MKYTLKLYNTVEDFENRAPTLIEDGYPTIGEAIQDGQHGLTGGMGLINGAAMFKVESSDQEEIYVWTAVKRRNFKQTWDGGALDIYIDNGDDKDPTTICYWVCDEWIEDSETVTPAMVTALELFYTNPQDIFNKLKLNYYLVD